MTISEKREFINDLINNVRASVLSKVERMPKEWDGIELREYIAAKFNDARMGHMSKSRRKDYENVVIVENL